MSANNVEYNFREKVMPEFMGAFDCSRVYSKYINTQLLDNVFDANSGQSVAFKRPTDFVAVETDDGDLTGKDPSGMIVGNAFGRVQPYITVMVEYRQIEQALKLNSLSELLAPAGKRMAVQFELNCARMMLKNTSMLSGTVGTPMGSWGAVGGINATMTSHGVPEDGDWTVAVNPFTEIALAEGQKSIGAGGSAGKIIKQAHERAIITDDFAGMRVIKATTQSSYTTGAGADRAGTLASNPDVTYVGAKDTFTQILSLSGFGSNLVIKAGEQITVDGRNRLNLATREEIVGAAGQPVQWSGTVTADVTLSGAGAGNVVVSGPAIYETDGAFNTVSSALSAGDIVTLLGSASSKYQPNLFWHKNAFSIGTVALPKLHAQENIGTTEDGIRIKMTRGSDLIKNKNMVRFDILPAFAVLNPHLAGHGWG